MGIWSETLHESVGHSECGPIGTAESSLGERLMTRTISLVGVTPRVKLSNSPLVAVPHNNVTSNGGPRMLVGKCLFGRNRITELSSAS